jgi:hypothetical protein
MALVSINRNPSRRDLNVFGIGLVPFSALLAAGAHFRHGNDQLALVFLGVGAALAFVYFVVPGVKRPIYLAWLYATFPIGWTVSHVVMGLVFFGVLTPIALIMRLGGRDALKLRLDRNASTYWAPHDPSGKVDRYFRQF